jgi:hypothetical protein
LSVIPKYLWMWNSFTKQVTGLPLTAFIMWTVLFPIQCMSCHMGGTQG